MSRHPQSDIKMKLEVCEGFLISEHGEKVFRKHKFSKV